MLNNIKKVPARRDEDNPLRRPSRITIIGASMERARFIRLKLSFPRRSTTRQVLRRRCRLPYQIDGTVNRITHSTRTDVVVRATTLPHVRLKRTEHSIRSGTIDYPRPIAGTETNVIRQNKRIYCTDIVQCYSTQIACQYFPFYM